MFFNFNNKRLIYFLISSVLLSILVLFFLPAGNIRYTDVQAESNEGEDVVILKEVEGEVYKRGSGFWIFPGFWRSAGKDSKLKPGESLKTKTGSCELLFLSGTKVYVEEDTEIKLIEDKSGDLQIQRLEMNQGFLIINLYEDLRKNLSFEIETPSAVAGVRGTKFSVQVREDKETYISVLEGEVEVANKVLKSTIKSKEKAHIFDNRDKFEVLPFEQKDIELWEKREKNIEKVEDVKEQVEKIKENQGITDNKYGKSQDIINSINNGPPEDLPEQAKDNPSEEVKNEKAK